MDKPITSKIRAFMIPRVSDLPAQLLFLFFIILFIFAVGSNVNGMPVYLHNSWSIIEALLVGISALITGILFYVSNVEQPDKMKL